MSYLYLIRRAEFYKIGSSANPKERLKNLQIANAESLELVYCFNFDDAEAVEKAIHYKFKHRKIRSE